MICNPRGCLNASEMTGDKAAWAQYLNTTPKGGLSCRRQCITSSLPLLVPPQTVGLLQILVGMCDICLGRRLEKTTRSFYSMPADVVYWKVYSWLPTSIFLSTTLLPDGNNRENVCTHFLKQILMISMKICGDERQALIMLDQPRAGLIT